MSNVDLSKLLPGQIIVFSDGYKTTVRWIDKFLSLYKVGFFERDGGYTDANFKVNGDRHLIDPSHTNIPYIVKVESSLNEQVARIEGFIEGLREASRLLNTNLDTSAYEEELQNLLKIK